jgi:sulfur-oxidizing protein SoxY
MQVKISLTRRDVLSCAGVGAAALIGLQIAPQPAHATAESAREAIRALIGDKTPQQGRVTLKLPEIAEDGSTVPLTIKVDSPMTEADYVKSVHVIAEGNPLPDVASFHFTPRSGLAVISTRMRLAKTQDVLAVAEMSDGSVYMARRTITVTIGGCGT